MFLAEMGCSEDRHNLTIQEGPGLLEAENQSWAGSSVEWLLAPSLGVAASAPGFCSPRLSLSQNHNSGLQNPRGMWTYNLFRDPISHEGLDS